jgi:hypothetical protein
MQTGQFNFSNYFSKFTHLFSEETNHFLQQLDNYVELNIFEEISGEIIKKAFDLYRDASILSNMLFDKHQISVDMRKQTQRLDRIHLQLTRFFDSYTDVIFRSYLSGLSNTTEEIRFQLKKFLEFRENRRKKKIAIQFAVALYEDFKEVCAEMEMKLFFLYEPMFGNPDATTISLEWPEFVLDKSGEKYTISEYTSNPPSCIREEEFHTRLEAFNALKDMAKKYYVLLYYFINS